jgi:hypothetical protein
VVQLEFEEIKETIRMEKEADKNTWTELWSTPGNRHRLLVLITLGLFSQWSGNGINRLKIGIFLRYTDHIQVWYRIT